jgi:hypothetical protein
MKLEKIKPRNWVAKNNRCRSARHQDHTRYQRQAKHRYKDTQYEKQN